MRHHLLLPLLTLPLLLTGCAQLAPWERDILAKPQMALEPAPQVQVWRQHVQASREAAGPVAVGNDRGGGCGCY